MRSDVVLVAALVATAAYAMAPNAAHAFCRATSLSARDFSPSSAGGDCFGQGVPLYHPSLCIPYHLLAEESAVLPRAALSNAFARAFAAWTAPNATCSPGISGIELAPVADTAISVFKRGERNDNVFGVVRGPWPHEGAREGANDTLALATTTFDAETGEIHDVDLEIKENERWSLSGTPPAGTYDLQAILTHEIGHLLGLAHTQRPEAVMAPTYAAGSTSQRALSADDGSGICAIYPDRQTRSTSTGLVASTACDLSQSPSGPTCGDPVITHGCAVGATSTSRGGPWLMAFAILAALALRVQRRH